MKINNSNKTTLSSKINFWNDFRKITRPIIIVNLLQFYTFMSIIVYIKDILFSVPFKKYLGMYCQQSFKQMVANMKKYKNNIDLIKKKLRISNKKIINKSSIKKITGLSVIYKKLLKRNRLAFNYYCKDLRKWYHTCKCYCRIYWRLKYNIFVITYKVRQIIKVKMYKCFVKPPNQ